MARATIALLLLVVACGSEATPPPAPSVAARAPSTTAAPAAASTAAPSSPTPPTLPAEPAIAEPAIALPEVELLHAVTTRVAVSSAYRDDADQVPRLVDGDLDTAWNSRTGDLVGAWIEIDVPAEARVRAIALTTGYTHVSERADLFTGNHRITRVRLSRDGVVLGEHDLDTAPRTPVEISVDGPGGRFRIEVLGTLPGTRDDWQEICVSEVRVLGTSALARPSSARPETFIGALTGTLIDAERTAEAREDSEYAAEVTRLDVEVYEDLLLDWIVYIVGVDSTLDREGGALLPLALERASRERRALFQRASDLVEDIDVDVADALDDYAALEHSPWAMRSNDLGRLLDAYEVVAGPERRCRTATIRANTWVQMVRAVSETYGDELEIALESGYDDDGGRLSSARRTELRQARTEVSEFFAWLRREGVGEGDESLPASRRRALLAGTLGLPTELASDWSNTRAELERAERECGDD